MTVHLLTLNLHQLTRNLQRIVLIIGQRNGRGETKQTTTARTCPGLTPEASQKPFRLATSVADNLRDLLTKQKVRC